MSTILVTGGAGFIGAHTSVALLEAGHRVVCLDDYRNSSPRALERVRRITGKDLVAVEGDVRDAALLDRLFAAHPIDGVIHFAALKAVEGSVRDLHLWEAKPNADWPMTRAIVVAEQNPVSPARKPEAKK